MRAGEQGRGFAIVSSEVRNLAQRSSTPAKEIKHLIETSVERVRDGSALGQINQAIGQLDQMTHQNAAMVEQYAGATEELAHRTLRLIAAVRIYRPSSR